MFLLTYVLLDSSSMSPAAAREGRHANFNRQCDSTHVAMEDSGCLTPLQCFENALEKLWPVQGVAELHWARHGLLASPWRSVV